MNISDQIRLKLQLKENSEVEYKSAAGGFPKVEFWRSFSALANTNGGTIVLGVKEKNHKFTPDGLSEELIAKYRKQFWNHGIHFTFSYQVCLYSRCLVTPNIICT